MINYLFPMMEPSYPKYIFCTTLDFDGGIPVKEQRTPSLTDPFFLIRETLLRTKHRLNRASFRNRRYDTCYCAFSVLSVIPFFVYFFNVQSRK